MRLSLLTSTATRHAYVASALEKFGDLGLVVCEEKGLDAAYADHRDRALIEDHFRRLAVTESAFFPEASWDRVTAPVVTVPRGRLNGDETARSIAESRPDVVAVFGCGVIKAPVFEVLPRGRTVNLHQGLSPYYRGSGTNFWPFADDRLEYIGVTLHVIDKGIDTGLILGQGRPDIRPDDSLHAIGCRTVARSVELFQHLLELAEDGRWPDGVPQWEEGKLYKRADFDGEAIRKARELEGTGIVAKFVERRDAGQVSPIRLVELEP